MDRTSSIKEAIPVLRKNHDSCPKVLTLSASNRIKLRHLLSTAHAILAHHCAQKDADTENEMTYLYEYNWLNEKTLVPLLDSDIDLYQKILARNSDVRSSEKCAILFSLLRSFLDYGDGENWNIKYAELIAMKAYFTAEQQEQIRWEECLHSLFRYEFQKLKQQLKKWRVSPDQTLWALRKSGLCAEVGEYDAALSLLQNLILSISK